MSTAVPAFDDPAQRAWLEQIGERMRAADIAYAAGERPRTASLCLQILPVLTPDECELLFRQIDKKASRTGLVTSPADPRIGIVDPARYVAVESFFDPTESKFKWLAHRLAPYIEEAAALFDLPALRLAEAARLIWYGEGGHFNWHPDSSANVGRRLTLSLQLSATHAYSGGDLMMIGESAAKDWTCADRAQGSACLFPSRLFHRVTPITGGNRAAIVLWFY